MSVQSLNLNSYINNAQKNAESISVSKNTSNVPIQNLSEPKTTQTDNKDVVIIQAPQEKPKKVSKGKFALGMLAILALLTGFKKLKLPNFDPTVETSTIKRGVSEVFEDITSAKKLEEMALPKSLEEITKKIVSSIKNPDLVEARGGKRIGSILLYGPPGTGKTTYVKALAKMFPDSEFASVDVTKITSKWVGETEKNLQKAVDEICERADKFPDKKIFVFIDEIDSVMMVDRPDVKHSNDALNEFKRCFSEKLAKRKNIITVGATNLDIKSADPTTGKKLDRAMLDRFEQKIFVGLPTPEQIKKAIVTHYKGKTLVADELKDLNSEKLKIIAEFLGKKEHNVSFRTLESIFAETANSIDDKTTRVGAENIFNTIQNKAKELNLGKFELEELAKKLGVEFKASTLDALSETAEGAKRRIGFV